MYPNVFSRAVDLAGGFGILIVFGILPSFIMVKMAKGGGWLIKTAAAVMVVSFSILMFCEIAQETGLFRKMQTKEYWQIKYHVKKEVVPN